MDVDAGSPMPVTLAVVEVKYKGESLSCNAPYLCRVGNEHIFLIPAVVFSHYTTPIGMGEDHDITLHVAVGDNLNTFPSGRCTLRYRFTLKDVKASLSELENVRLPKPETFLQPISFIEVMSSFFIAHAEDFPELGTFIPLVTPNAISYPAVFQLDPLVVNTTPFGSCYMKTFSSSWFRTIASNVIGQEGHNNIIVIDGCSLDGGQGGLVYKYSTGTDNSKLLPVGIIIQPVILKQEQSTGLAIVASINPILAHCRHYLNTTPVPVNPPCSATLTSLNFGFVIKIRAGVQNGSAVKLSKTVFLTCAHVVGDRRTVHCIIENERLPLNVVYKSNNADLFDIAVLQPITVELDEVPRAQVCSKDSVNVLRPVLAVGYGPFENRIPTITHGVISNIKTIVGAGCSWILSTCKVHPGSSGGALVNVKGELIGILTSCIRDDNERNFPIFSQAIPMSIIEAGLAAWDASCFDNKFLPWLASHNSRFFFPEIKSKI